MTPRLRCPACGGDLPWPDRDTKQVDCACGKVWASLAGIVDLRSQQDPYCGNRRDGEIAADLLENFETRSFEALLARYYQRHCPELRPADVQRQIRHIVAGSASFAFSGFDRSAAVDSPILDLGCGSGTALIAFAHHADHRSVVGMDIAMRWLLLARKRLDEAGLDDIRLVCGEGEALPFPNGTFGGVHGGDVIEHVADAEAVLAETARVLRPGGRALFRTPNRLSLAPEPHVGLPFAGWLPGRLARGYCRILNAPPWHGIFTRTHIGWSSACRTVSGRYPEVTCEVAAASVRAGEQRRSGLVTLYDAALRRSRPFRAFAATFGPILEIRLKKGLERPIAPAGPFGKAPGFQQGERPG